MRLRSHFLVAAQAFVLASCSSGGHALLEPTAPSTTSARTESAVCGIWAGAFATTATNPVWTAGASQCAVGTLSASAATDTLTRINGYRALLDLPPVTEDAGQRDQDQACAELMNVNHAIDHTPPSSWTCYSPLQALGAVTGAGSSNLAFGSSSPAGAIDLFIRDSGTDSLGHRRWVLNFDLGKVGIGFAGSSTCLGVFDGSGSSSAPWTAYPPAGFAPIETGEGAWTFHTTTSTAGGRIAVFRVSDGRELAGKSYVPAQGYGVDAIAFEPEGWTPEVGETYRVQAYADDRDPIVYDVTFVDCTP